MADDITLSVLVNGTEVNDEANGLEVAGEIVPASSLEWEHESDGSMSVDGEPRTDSKRQEAESAISVRVTGATVLEWRTRLTALCGLVDEEGYEVIVSINGTVIHHWEECSAASIRPVGGSGWQKTGFMNREIQQTVQIEFLHSPVPAAGLPF